MKKNRLFTIILVAALSGAQGLLAQTALSKGLKLGLNFSNLFGNDVNPPDDIDKDLAWYNKIGIGVGSFLCFKTSRLLAIQPELWYTQKGAKDEDVYRGDKYSTHIRLNYLEVPVLFKFYPPTQHNLKPYLCLGPAFAYKLSAKCKVEEPFSSFEKDLEDIKNTDYSFILGVGLNFKFGSGQNTLLLEGRYSIGLASTDGSTVKEDIKNKVVSAVLGFEF